MQNVLNPRVVEQLIEPKESLNSNKNPYIFSNVVQLSLIFIWEKALHPLKSKYFLNKTFISKNRLYSYATQ